MTIGEMLDYIYYNMYNIRSIVVVVICVLNGFFLRAQNKEKKNGRSEKPKNTFYLRKLN